MTNKITSLPWLSVDEFRNRQHTYYRSFAHLLNYFHMDRGFIARPEFVRTMLYCIEQANPHNVDRWKVNLFYAPAAQKVNGTWMSGDKEVSPWDAYRLDAVIAYHTTRLELSYISAESWEWREFLGLFCHQPYMRQQFGEALVWRARPEMYMRAGVEYGYRIQNVPPRFFHVPLGEQNALDLNDNPIDRAVLDSAAIDLAHPAMMTPNEVAAWQHKLHDYEIVQPFQQLMRPIEMSAIRYRMPAEWDHLAFIGLSEDSVTRDHGFSGGFGYGQALRPAFLYDASRKVFFIPKEQRDRLLYGDFYMYGVSSDTWQRGGIRDYEITVTRGSWLQAELSYQLARYCEHMKEKEA